MMSLGPAGTCWYLLGPEGDTFPPVTTPLQDVLIRRQRKDKQTCWELELHKSVDQYLNGLAMICMNKGEGSELKPKVRPELKSELKPELKPKVKPSGHMRSSMELLLHNQLH